MHRASLAPRTSRRALLIDLENILRTPDGSLLEPAEAADVLDRIQQRSGPVDYMLAVAPASVVRRYAAELAAAGLRWSCCEPGPDSADREICQLSCDLVAHGYTELVISSADHFFECLASVASLTVVVPRGLRVSYRLWRSAVVLAA